MDPATLEQLLGPLGLTIFLIITVIAFSTERVVPGSRAIRAEAAAKEALVLAQQANAVMEKMADALEERNRFDADKLRLGGGKV